MDLFGGSGPRYGIDTIPQLFKYGIYRRQACPEGARKKIFESAKLNASVYKSSLDGVVKLVVSVPGVEGVTDADGAVDGSALSTKQTFEGVACFIWDSVSSSDYDIINTVWKELANCLKFEECLFN